MFVKNMVHAGLEGGWCIGKPKRHDKELIMPIVASKICLLYVMFPHPDLMVSIVQVNFGEVHSTM
jgi:hypothetical protein